MSEIVIIQIGSQWIVSKMNKLGERTKAFYIKL